MPRTLEICALASAYVERRRQLRCDPSEAARVAEDFSYPELCGFGDGETLRTLHSEWSEADWRFAARWFARAAERYGASLKR